ncbi:MauE/DoxX family redox-associated membrane protein [Gluconacetobacter tumulicola]|uniref:Methylamine utilization protein MauE n=1 Tax=Gluconacetobacter tumulicola TaxID=1017177 RepID=A0A7W4JAQ4_9PROT|nr:MauE/DoxX family redox-associated membrane protein [Gluconacetobacter tumulicola]MBB2177726.1 hypothetical protein [Gluconacetobacter tumulicola]
MQANVPSCLSLSLVVFILLVFLRASGHKLFSFTVFTGYVADYRLITGRFLSFVCGGLVAAEILVVLLQLLPISQIFGLVLAAGLLVTYSAGMAINIVRGHTDIECGCGGAVQHLSWSLVIRNCILLALICAVAMYPSRGLDAFSTEIAVLCGFLFWIVFLLSEQILANSSLVRLTQ